MKVHGAHVAGARRWSCAFAVCSSARKRKRAGRHRANSAGRRRQSVSQFVTAEAVVFPLKQATVAPKITSTVADFKVQRGSRVKKGPAARDSGKQRSRRAGRSEPGRFRTSRRQLRDHRELRTAATDSESRTGRRRGKIRHLTRHKRFTTAAKIFFNKARFRGATSTARTSRWRKHAARTSKRKNNSPIFSAWEKSNCSKPLKERKNRRKVTIARRRRSSATPKFAARSMELSQIALFMSAIWPSRTNRFSR